MNGIGKSIDTEAEEAKEKDAKQAHQAAADSTQPSEGVDDGAVDPESNGDAATAPRSPAPAPSSGSGPEASQEAFTFIKMLLNTLSIALTANVDNRRYFRSEIRFAALAEALQVCVRVCVCVCVCVCVRGVATCTQIEFLYRRATSSYTWASARSRSATR
jgi:hypothetical protein